MRVPQAASVDKTRCLAVYPQGDPASLLASSPPKRQCAPRRVLAACVLWLSVGSVFAASATADAPSLSFDTPVPGGLVVSVCLPHIPPDASCRISIDGGPTHNETFGEGVSVTVPAERMAAGRHSLSVRIYDPQFRTRYLYVGSATVVKNPAPDVETATHTTATATSPPPTTDIVFGLDGSAWTHRPADGDHGPAWDGQGRLSAWLGETATEESVVATARLLGDGDTRISAGTQRLEAEVSITNSGQRPVRVLSCDLGIVTDDGHLTNCLVVPIGARPAVIGDGGTATQSFRADTFDDTPSGTLHLKPIVAVVAQEQDLMQGGDFDQPVVVEGDPQPTQWWLPRELQSIAGAECIRGEGPACRSLTTLLLDWRTYSQIQTSNQRGANLSGEGYVQVNLSERPKATTPVMAARVAGLAENTDYLFGCASWGGDDASVELLDGAGEPQAGQRRSFSGFWWRADVPNWTERALLLPGRPGVTGADVILSSRNQASSWDACYLVAKENIRVAQLGDTGTLVVAPSAPIASEEPCVVYLGEDRQTQGNWIGNYGSYCWVLSAMSAPRDMVGGEVTPAKCKTTAFADELQNEVVWTRGKGAFRYTSSTTDPSDALTRHWIGAMRTVEARALENPQWGGRTYASWDDHGELHPTDGWGPDLVATLQMPPGVWRLGLYFIDWDWYSAPFPRAHRIELSTTDDRDACTARVTDFGGGVYKVFGVRGGRDLTIRLRKDRSAAVLISGIFLDPLRTPDLHVAGVGLDDATSRGLRELTDLWDTAGAGCLIRTRDALPPLACQLSAAALADGAAESPALQRLRLETWQHRPGANEEVKTAFDAYVNALVATTDRARAIEHLRREADAFLAAGVLAPAQRRYDAVAHLLSQEGAPGLVADAHRDIAIKFRSIHPLYAQRRVAACVEVLGSMPETTRIAYLREMARELFDRASGDWKQARGIVRVPYALAEYAYGALAEQIGYENLEPEERANLMLCCKRQTWYSLGWERLAAEQERLIASIPPEQVEGALLADLVRTYAVLAQSDPHYAEKAETQCAELRKQRPDGDWALESYFRMAQIYYNLGMWAKAREACRAVVATWPDGAEAKEAKRLLEQMQGK